MIKDIINMLTERRKKNKKFKSATRAETQDIFKKIHAGGKRYWNPKNESRSDNKEYKRILKQVRKVRKDNPAKGYHVDNKNPELYKK